MKIIKIHLLWLFLLWPILASALTIDGVWEQGGYIKGKAHPKSGITVNGKYAVVDSAGNFLYGLSRNFPVEAVIKNILLSGKVQTKIIIVEPKTFEIQKITGVPKNTVNPNKEELARIKVQSASILAARKTRTSASHDIFSMQMPLRSQYRTSGVYGSRRIFADSNNNWQERSWHKGVDMASPKGTTIYASAGGKVKLADKTFFSGNLVIIDHGLGLFTHYAHMNNIMVKKGQKVTANTVIGTVGSTGRSTGPHLHWGMYWKNIAINPILWVSD